MIINVFAAAAGLIVGSALLAPVAGLLASLLIEQSYDKVSKYGHAAGTATDEPPKRKRTHND